MKKVINLIIILSLFSCLTDNPEEVKSDSTLTKLENNIVENIPNGKPLQKTQVYKILENRMLKVLMHIPVDVKAGEKRTAITLFHGGGWFLGDYSKHMRSYFNDFADLGYITFSVQYRLAKTDKTVTIEECVEDAKDFLKWLHLNAEVLNIDKEKIIFSGLSAGGHLAAATLFSDELQPNGVILYSSALDLDADDWAKGLIRDDQDIISLSPYHIMKSVDAPVLILHGEKDEIAKIDTIQNFQNKMEDLGNKSELTIYDATHEDLYKNSTVYNETILAAKEFLDRYNFTPQ